jgi:hypothetical protein
MRLLIYLIKKNAGIQSFVVIILVLLLSSGCNKKNPCKDLQNGIFLSPELPANQTMTSAQIDNYLDIPKDIAECISTEGLIESILNYPFVSLISAGSTSQSGYVLLKSKYSGLSELEKRGDRGKCLLQKYLSRDPLNFDKSWVDVKIGGYIITETYLEVILGQYINLRDLGTADFKNMFLRSLEVYDLEKTEPDYYGYFGLSFSTVNVARMMLIANYKPFVSLYNIDDIVYNFTETYRADDASLIELIHEMALEYSKTIKK